MMNIVNGGVHADNPIDFQEFMILPVGAPSLRRGGALGRGNVPRPQGRAEESGPQHQRRRRGGLRPQSAVGGSGARLLLKAIEAAGFKAGDDIALGLDCAASEFFKDGDYVYSGEGKTRSVEEQVEYLAKLADAYPILSIEDGMAEDDWAGWKLLTEKLGARRQLVGDDIFVTNVEILERGIKEGVANSILIKVNQIGSLSETLGRRRYGAAGGLYRGDVAPVGRDRGLRRSPISRSRPIADRSRPARSPGRIAWRNTIN